jgi:MFS family permease
MTSGPTAKADNQAGEDRYKWVALANTTAAMFMATLDGSIVIIALPAIFRGIHLDPLGPGNVSYLLWMIMGYRLVQAVLVVTVGRLGDMFGLGAVLVAATYGIQPYGGHTMGWTNPWVLTGLAGGVALLVVFGVIETRVAEPMFQLSLFRIRAFTAGNLAGLATSIARGGLQFMLIIWLQGIWLPLHGYNFSDTPLWAGIFLLPLTAGFLVSGPVSGILSDRFGSRGIATGGMAVFGGSFIGLMLLPANFPYLAFALLIAANGIGSGMFASPNSSSIMGSVPAGQRGVASGMRSTFQNSGTAVSIAVFFSLMIAGLASSLPKTLTSGLQQQGVPHALAHQIGALPPVSSLFAAVLGVNPVQHLLAAGGVLSSLPAASQRILTGREFFPNLISVPFHHGLVIVFAVSAALAALAGLASLLRGGRQAVAEERPQADEHPKPLNRRVG